MKDYDENDPLLAIISQSGFKIVSMQAVIDALSVMEKFLMDATGTDQKELDLLLDKLETLVGKEEAMKMDLDEIVNWIKTFQDC